MKGRRLLTKYQAAGTSDDMKLRSTLLRADGVEEYEAGLPRRRRIVARPNDLNGNLHAAAPAGFPQLRPRAAHARGETCHCARFDRVRRVAMRFTFAGSNAGVEQRSIDMHVAIG